MKNHPPLHRQTGSTIIESLIAILVFSLGIVAMMSVSRVGISSQSDAQVRSDAARLANEIVQQMWLQVDRTSRSDEPLFQNSLKAFEYQPDGTDCEFSGSDASASVTTLPVGSWLTKVGTSLPGSSSAAFHQIKVENTPAGGLNQVTVTLCWQAPADLVPRKHSLTAQVN